MNVEDFTAQKVFGDVVVAVTVDGRTKKDKSRALWDAGYDKDMINRVSLNPKLSETNRRIQCSFPPCLAKTGRNPSLMSIKKNNLYKTIRHMMGER